MKLDLTYLEQMEPAARAEDRHQTSLLPGLAALMLIVTVGLVSVIPARASVYPGLGWAQATGTVGGQADSHNQDICNIGAALSQGLEPVCTMTLP